MMVRDWLIETDFSCVGYWGWRDPKRTSTWEKARKGILRQQLEEEFVRKHSNTER